MDLERELLEVLDNPGTVWEAVVANLSGETRTALLALSTCTTPIDLVEWQAAVARISIEAAARFEASLRILDDAFVRTARKPDGGFVVGYRNPSMDDFCAAVLDSNVGFAIKVATSQPSPQQVERMLQLGTATVEPLSRRRQYPNIYDALIRNPESLLQAIIQQLPDLSEPTSEWLDMVLIIVKLIQFAESVREPTMSRVQALTAPILSRCNFERHFRFVYATMQNDARGRVVMSLLGERFEAFYAGLQESASDLSDYGVLVDIDLMLERPGSEAPWRDLFFTHEETWRRSAEANAAESDRDEYERVVEHLDGDERADVDFWYEWASEAEQQDREPDEDDLEWMSSGSASRSPSGPSAPVQRMLDEITMVDALFSGLQDRA